MPDVSLESPAITVLMPVYNGMKFLRPAIEGVLNQTFTNFEFLILDDASTDESVELIVSYQDPRIRLVRNEKNLGQTASLNKGLQLARGAYIARLDQDDVCLPDRLKEQLAYFRKDPDIAISCCWEYSINSSGQRIRSWEKTINNFGEFLGNLLVAKSPVWHPSVMFHRSVVMAMNGYDESYGPAEDFELWTRLALSRAGAAIVPKPLVLQRVHEGRQSHKHAAIQWRNTRRAHLKLVKTLCESEHTELVALLLRTPTEIVTVDVPYQESLQGRCFSGERLKKALVGLDETFSAARRKLHLTPLEFSSMKKVILRRVGLGVRFRRQLAWLPPFLFPLSFYALSPLLIPPVRLFFSNLNTTIAEFRHPARWFRPSQRN